MPWCVLHSLGCRLVARKNAALRLGRYLRSSDGVNGVVFGVDQSLGWTRSLRLERDQSCPDAFEGDVSDRRNGIVTSRAPIRFHSYANVAESHSQENQ